MTEQTEDYYEDYYEYGDYEEDLEAVEDIQREGHTYHCACRQIWGDGECECDLPYPYWWVDCEE